ncbi:MAG: penicillin-binding protein, partial [Acidimicrobiales bacterium]
MESTENHNLDPVKLDTLTDKKPRKKGRYWTFFKWSAGAGFVLGLCAIVFVGVFVIRATRDLPSIEALQQYSPAVMSRVQAGDGKLIAEYGIEKRVFVPIESIPLKIQHALVASEDQRFYTHNGFDPKGFARAMSANLKHKLTDIFTGNRTRLEGGSTLTQQVAKHFLVGNERNIERKVREIFIAKRIEKAISKDEILELYLNDVFFGRRAYGIAGASLNYFNKPLDELTLGQSAYLAGLVKGPNNYQPENNMEKAIDRRNYVLNRMVIDGYASQEDVDEAKTEELVIADRLFGDEYLAAEYFVDEVRKQVNELYGEEQLNKGGLSIRTTLDTKMQLAARRALRRGLEMYD